MSTRSTSGLLDALQELPTWSTVTSTTYRPEQRHKDLIRCEYCGMSYDGGEHENCPHCLAPRTPAHVGRLRTGGDASSSPTVLYRDNVAYGFMRGATVNDEI